MIIDREQLAWAGGLFEGEGGWSQQVYTTTKGINRYYPRANLVSSDLDILEKFQTTVGFGKISPKRTNIGTKCMWVWQTSSVEQTVALCAMLWEWLGSRRRSRIREIILCSRVGQKVTVAPYKTKASVSA